MAINYSAIRQDNIGKYGSEVNNYGPTLLAHLYSDRTHFIFELLQNAEDALSKRARCKQSFPREVLFYLFKDHLEFSHYGIPFSEDDVSGICGLVQSTKKEDATAIGKFGIGFKSVYAYTLSPEVHSGDEHFVIESFVRPSPLPPRRVSAGKTLFYLPFDNPKVSAEDAFEEIANRLKMLGAYSLLFLSQIETVEWKVEGRETGSYSRKNRKRDRATTYITLSSRDGRSKSEEEWICFEQPISFPKTSVKGKVQVAYSLQEKKRGRKEVQAIAAATLFAFFPTEKETHLGMLIQGPYRTTPSRDNIPKDDPWNKQLVKLTAELIGDSLIRLKDLDLLSVSALEAMPLNSQIFSTDHFLRPLFEAVKSALTKKPLIPRYEGGFVAGACAKIARGSGLRELLKPSHLQMLFGTTKKLEWVSDDISEDKTPQLREYLLHDVGVEELTPQTFGSRVTERFFKAQPDEWFIKLYTFLSDQPALWKPSGSIRMKPFIRTQANRHITPFASDGTPQIYLPSKGFTGYEVVKEAICKNRAASEFLSQLGLTEPDLVDDVIRNVLPKYSAEQKQIADHDYSSDISRLLMASKTDSKGQREKLIAALRESHFVMAMDTGDGTKRCATPTEVYIVSQRLKELFQCVPGVLLADDSYTCLRGEGIRQLLEGCGASQYLQPVEVGSVFTWQQKEEMRTRAGAANSSGGERIQDFTLRGLDQLLKTIPTLPSEEASKKTWLLWEALCDLAEQCGTRTFSGTYRWYYYYQRRCDFDAAFVHRLNETAWVPDKNGTLQPPGCVIFEDINPPWQQNAFLLTKIHFKPRRIEELAKEAGIEPGVLDLLKRHGVTSVADVMARLRIQEEPEQSNGQPRPTNVDDSVKSILGDTPGPTPPVSEPMDRESSRAGVGIGRGSNGPGHGTGTAGGGTPRGSTGSSKTDGKSSTTGISAGKRAPGSAGGRQFISYVGTHPDDEESDLDGLDQPARMALEAQAIMHILSHEPDLTRTPTNNLGFDLVQMDPEGTPIRWIEVKAMTGSLMDRPVGLSRTQFECAQEHGNSYWLYAVERAGSSSARIVRIQDPAGKARTFTFDHGWLGVAELTEAEQSNLEQQGSE